MDCYMIRRGSPYLVYDRFNRANGNLGSAETGQVWLSNGVATTAWGVSSNVAKRTTVTTSINDIAYVDCGRADVTVSADITIGGNWNSVRLVARMSGSVYDNCMSLYIDSGNRVQIQRKISGSAVEIGTASQTLTKGETYACVLTCSGNDFTASINGVVKVSVTDDNALKTNTQVGMYWPNVELGASQYIDNFLAKRG